MDDITASLHAPFNLRDWLSSGQSHLSNFSTIDQWDKVSWVFACVNKIAGSIANAPFEILEGKKPITENHPMWQYFNPPNGKIIATMNHLMKISITQKEIFGGAFWIFDDRKKNIIPVWDGALAPLMSPNNTDLLGWEWTGGLSVRRFRAEDVFWWRYPHPVSFLRSVPPLTAARWAVEQEVNQAATNAKAFKRGLSSKLIAYSPDGLTTKQKDEILRDVENQASGLAGAEFMVLTGKFNLEKVSLNLKEMEYALGRQMTREEICAVFQVPPALVGIYQYANYANAEFQGKSFWMNKIMPDMLDLKRTFELHCQGMGYDLMWEWDEKHYKDRLVPLLERIEAAEKLVGMGMPLEEALIIADIESDYKPSQAAPIPPGPIPPPPGPQTPTPPPEPPPDDSQNDSGKQKSALDLYAWTVMEAEAVPITAAFVKVFSATCRRQLKMGFDFQVDYTFWADKLAEKLLPKMERFFAAGWNVLAAQAGKDVGPDTIKEDLYTPPGVDAETYAIQILPLIEELTRRYSETTSGAMSKEVEMLVWGMLAREAPRSEIEKAVSDMLTAPKWPRAISRAATGAAFNSGKFINSSRAGIPYNRWVCLLDGRERLTHHREHGNIVPVGQPFPITGLRYPHDPNGPLKEVINCRCSLDPVTAAKPSDRLNKWFSPSKILSSITSMLDQLYKSFTVAGWRKAAGMVFLRAKGAGEEMAGFMRSLFPVKGQLYLAAKADLVRVCGSKGVRELIARIKDLLTPLTPGDLGLELRTGHIKQIAYIDGSIVIPKGKVFLMSAALGEKTYKAAEDPENYLGQLCFALGQAVEDKWFREEMAAYRKTRVDDSEQLTPQELVGVAGASVAGPDNNLGAAFLGMDFPGPTMLTGHVYSMIGPTLHDDSQDFELGVMFLRDTETFIKVLTLAGDVYASQN